MRQAAILFLYGLSFFFLPSAYAQPDHMAGDPTGSAVTTGRPDMEFGNVTPETFTPSVYALDSSANAVILFDKGVVTYDPRYQNNGYSIIFERHTRIRILNKNALGLASFSLSTYRKGNASPTLEAFKGATYNMEDGKLVVTKLDKSNIFKDQNNSYDFEKIAFPNVKEGSVIEYSFRIVYPGYGFIPPWHFQGSYPELWSEYDITVPGLFEFFVKTQGYQPFVTDTTALSTDEFYIGFAGGNVTPPFHGTWSGQTVRRVWAEQNIPALEKKEPYTTTLNNHISKIEFQLSGVRLDGYSRSFRGTWKDLTKELQQSDNFGNQLTDHNRWMDDELKAVTASDKTPSPETARRLFVYVRDHFNATPVESIWLSKPLKKVWEDKGGNVADINLLLTAVYKHEGFDATPVILSTRAHGLVLEQYPLLNEYNYVITRLRLNGKEYLLDASKPYTGFGLLPEICYNGVARAVDEGYEPVPLLPDSVREVRRTIVTLSNSDSGYSSGRFERILGTFESMNMRSLLKREKEEDYFEGLHKSMPDSKQMTDYGFDSLNVQEAPLAWHYNMKYRFSAKRFYFNPLIHERYTNNPFPSPERHYPVEMPYCTEHYYSLRMEVPKGYVVEQLPQSKRIMLAGGDGFFEYRIEQEGDVISCHTELRLGKATYGVEEYQGLRDFYSLIVEKEKDPIIFKKIN